MLTNRPLSKVHVLLIAAAMLLGVVAATSARTPARRVSPRGSLLVQKNRPRGVIRSIRRRPGRAPAVRPEPAHRKILRAIAAARGSVSLGNTSTGRLLRGAQLPLRGKHHAVLPRWRKRRTNYGTDELLSLLQHAARQVAKAHPGSRMMVGNLSLKRGGDIQWSQSHNAGRDGDIAFYLKRGRRFVVPTALVKVGRRLRTLRPRGLRFDVRRNWALIKALVTHKTIAVQWIFIAKHLKSALLQHARKLREPTHLVARADKILRQPTDSLSHDDHYHVRIYCSRADRLEGCRDRPPFWSGVKTHDHAVARRIRILEKGLSDAGAAIRLQALGLLVRLEARQSAGIVARRGLQDPDPRMRRAALGALLGWRNHDRAVIAALSHLIERPGSGVQAGTGRPARPSRRKPDTVRTGRQLRLAYDVLATLASRQSVPVLRRALRSKRLILGARGRRPLPEPLLAASAARSILDLRLVPALITTLEHPSPRVRRVVASSLRRLTNHTHGLGWGRRLKQSPPKAVGRQVAPVVAQTPLPEPRGPRPARVSPDKPPAPKPQDPPRPVGAGVLHPPSGSPGIQRPPHVAGPVGAALAVPCHGQLWSSLPAVETLVPSEVASTASSPPTPSAVAADQAEAAVTAG